MTDSSTPPPTDNPVVVELPPVFARHQAAVGAALRAELESKTLPIYDSLRYYMGWADANGTRRHGPEGKRLRPTLCLLACEAVGGEPADALPVAVAIELAHNFSLIHDDIEDGDRTRHHRPTLWVIWGEATAIVAGNNLLAIGDMAAHRLRAAGADTAVAAGHILTERYLSMMEGQYLDIAYEGRTDVTVDEYLAMIERKTGALIEGAVELGALVGAGGSGDVVDGLRAVGDDLGRIFQIRDDVLGIWGGPALGKPIGADITRKKNSLPVVHVLEHARDAEKRELQRIYAGDEIAASDVERVLEMMDGLGTQSWCQDQAAARWDRARARLASLKLSTDAAREFLELGEYLLVREV
ncbi:MAG: polyprenyl synthetase family protein [Dehalococcoidia bacterium]|jgi:geranylgeranyl diphosphate synthase type I|nr:polyprenyl synthetase family protein [Dehalococcoidia bacterium]